MTDRFTAHLPIGSRVPFPEDGLPGWDIFPFDGDLRVRPLDPPVLPEPARHGEDGPDSCEQCRNPGKNTIWSDEHWRVFHLGEPTAVPVVVLLSPLAHHDLSDLPAELAAGLGPMLQRVEQAIMSLGGIARVHVNKWGDGARHLHLWLIGRPAGMLQMRGICLPVWDDVLPKQDEAQWRSVMAELGAALAAGGGTAHA